MLSSIPPPQSRWQFPPTPLRPLLPIHPPPNLPDPLPALPSPQRVPHIHSAFALSTHLVPAANIRTTRHVPYPPPLVMPVPEQNLTRDERTRRATKVRAWLLEAKATEARSNVVGYERVLWNCVNRYYRVDSGRGKTGAKGLTLFFAHANGFPKEVCQQSALSRTLRNAPSLDLGADVEVPPSFVLSSHRRSVDMGSDPARRCCLGEWRCALLRL